MQKEIKRKLTSEEITDLCKILKVPFDSIREVVKRVQENLRKNLAIDLKYIEIYPSKIPKLKEYIYKSFYNSILDPQFPIGSLVADSAAQQVTQANLNSFHKVGFANTGGGSDGIREAISLSVKRKVEYTVIHFKNKSMTFEEVMNQARHFIGISLESLQKRSYIHVIDFLNADWWYQYLNISEIWKDDLQNLHTYTDDHIRGCLRIELDVQKLYEYSITTENIIEIINKNTFMANKEKFYCIAYPSPTIIGIVDIFIRKTSNDSDHLHVYSIQNKTLSKIMISGIVNITNFFPSKNLITSLIRDGENINGRLHLYFNESRFRHIPFFRLHKLITYAGYSYDPIMLQLFYLPDFFNYNPVVSVRKIKSFIIESSKYTPTTIHQYYTVQKIKENQWEITCNLPYLNSGLVYFSLENLLQIEFGNSSKILSSEKIDFGVDDPCEECIIMTDDSYAVFMDKLNHPFSKSCIPKVSKKSETLIFECPESILEDLSTFCQKKNYSTTVENNMLIVQTSLSSEAFLRKIEDIENEYCKYYVFAETLGSDFRSTLIQPIVDTTKTICNNYHTIFENFGLEALHTFLVYDLKSMINNSGYINGKHIELICDCLTHSGMNPMTSEGIVNHNRGSLAYATFDRVLQHLMKEFLTGKKENATSTSIAICLGQPVQVGTGAANIKSIFETSEESNKYLVSENIYNDQDILDVSEQEQIFNLPVIIPNKLSMLPWLFEEIIFRDFIFYIEQGLRRFENLPNTEKTSFSLKRIGNFKKAQKLLLK
jgi:hypothetical protein